MAKYQQYSAIKSFVMFLIIVLIHFGCDDEIVNPDNPDDKDTVEVVDTTDKDTVYIPNPVEEWKGKAGKIAFSRIDFEKDDRFLMTLDLKSDSIKVLLTDFDEIIPGETGWAFNDIIWSPDGKKIAFTSANMVDGAVFLFVIDEDGSNLKLLHTDHSWGGDIGRVKWHPDGKRIFFSARSEDIEYVDLEGNYYTIKLSEHYISSEKKIYGLGNTYFFDPDGIHIYLTGYWSNDYYLLKFNEKSGEIVKGFQLSLETLGIHMTPDCKKYLFTRQNSNYKYDTIIKNLDDGKEIVLENFSPSYFNWSYDSETFGTVIREVDGGNDSTVFYYIFEPFKNKKTKITNIQTIIYSHIYFTE